MNITELIVELLQKGQKVELSGIGTFDSMMQSPHHDAESRIYYPASRSIVFQKETSGDESIIKIIAQRECVNDEVAGQMWRNYCDALADKVKRTGSHQFGELGTLAADENGYHFDNNKDFVIEAGNTAETPLEEVKVYEHSDNEDPFAQFDAEPQVTVVERPDNYAEEEIGLEEPLAYGPVTEEEAAAMLRAEANVDAEPEVVPVVKTEPEEEVPAQPEPEVEVDEEWRETLRRLDEMPKSEEAQRAEDEARKKREKAEAKAKEKAEKERVKLERLAERHHELVTKLREESHEANARRDAENRRRAEEELYNAELRAEENRKFYERVDEASLALAEKKAEEERLKAEKRAAILAAVAAKESAGRPQAAAAPAATPDAEAASETENVQYEAPRIMTEKERKKIDKEVERRMKEDLKREEQEKKEAEREAIRQKKEEEKRQKEEVKNARKEAKEAEKQAKRDAKEAAKEAKRQAKEAAKQSKKKEKAETPKANEEKKGKGRRGWLIILLLLLVLLLGGGAAYYFLVMKGATPSTSGKVAKKDKHLNVPVENAFTYNVDMISYNKQEIAQNSNMVCAFLTDYISQFVTAEGYAKARVPMMDRVRQHSDIRINTLLGPRFAVQRFIPYNDYIYNYNEPCLKEYYADSARIIVQRELMDMDTLREMLRQVVDEFGLQPGNVAAETATAAPAPATTPAPTAKKKGNVNDNPVYVYVEKNSKQGFDIIAGFYLNKSTAAKMTARLHEQGCDAYIIEKNEMFYVSMGSAPTRTKAEALYNHIKGWYDGDIVIKQL